jgi:iron complex outermembrane receptor protein
LALTPTLFLAFLFSLAAGKANCAGQESIRDLAEATLEQLGSVKVYSASKHLQAACDAPSSVTVVTADEIQKYGYRTLADILKTVPGFFVMNDRNYSSVGVRGLARPGDYNTRILLLVDGHRLNDNVYDEAMVGTEFPINIDLIQRVEVIRGPVSSLYGSNALFGVINIITKRGRDINGLELSAEAASFNTYSGTITYGRKLRQLEFLISSTFYGSRGNNSLFFPEFNTPETNYGIARHADDDQVGSALATISFRDFTLQAVYGTREKGIPTAPYGTIFNNSGTRTTDSNSYIDLRYQHSFGNSWDVLARTFYDRYTYQGTYIYASPLDPSQTSPNLDFADGKWWGLSCRSPRRSCSGIASPPEPNIVTTFGKTKPTTISIPICSISMTNGNRLWEPCTCRMSSPFRSLWPSTWVFAMTITALSMPVETPESH